MPTYKLKRGYVWNPLLSIPPNSLCPCQSYKKFKHCCRKNLPRAIAPDWVAETLNELNKLVEKK